MAGSAAINRQTNRNVTTVQRRPSKSAAAAGSAPPPKLAEEDLGNNLVLVFVDDVARPLRGQSFDLATVPVEHRGECLHSVEAAACGGLEPADGPGARVGSARPGKPNRNRKVAVEPAEHVAHVVPLPVGQKVLVRQVMGGMDESLIDR